MGSGVVALVVEGDAGIMGGVRGEEHSRYDLLSSSKTMALN